MPKSSYRIAFMVDVKWRDLPGLALLKYFLETRYGHDVLLVRKLGHHLVRKSFRPHMAFLTHALGPNQRHLAHVLKQDGTLIGVLPTEGRGTSPSHLEVVAGKYSDSRDVDLYLAWSETVRDEMIRWETLPAERIVVTGVGRFDFYYSPLNRLLPSRTSFARQYGLEPDRQVVTWATNYTLAKYHVRGLHDFVRRDFQKFGTDKIVDWQEPDETAQTDYESQQLGLRAFATLVRSMPNVNFYIKPHPMEDISIYEDFVESLDAKNVAVVTNRYIWDLLAVTDVHLHRVCTTGAEAWILGKPTIQMHLVNGPWTNLEPREGEDTIYSPEDLLERVRYYLNGGQVPMVMRERRQGYIREWFYQVDGQRTAFQASVIDSFLRSRDPKVEPVPNLRDFPAHIDFWIRRRFGLPIDYPTASNKQKPPEFNVGIRDRQATPNDEATWIQRINAVQLSTKAAR